MRKAVALAGEWDSFQKPWKKRGSFFKLPQSVLCEIACNNQ